MFINDKTNPICLQGVNILFDCDTIQHILRRGVFITLYNLYTITLGFTSLNYLQKVNKIKKTREEKRKWKAIKMYQQ